LGFLNSDDYSSIKHVVRTTIDYVMGYLVSDDSYIALPDFTIILFKGKRECFSSRQHATTAHQNRTRHMKRNTLSIHCAYPRRDAYDALSMPVYESVAYEFDNAATMADVFCERVAAPDYSRVANPTVTHFEDRVVAITGARRVVAFNSGMAAISSALLSLTAAGANVVTSRHLFGNTYALLTETLARFGVEVRFCDLTRPEQLETVLDEHTACLFFEILTNPQLEVADVGMVATPMLYFAAVQHCSGSGVMITGSHNPPDYNGFKMMLGGNTLAGESIQELRGIIEAQDFVSGSPQGSVRRLDVAEEYIQHIAGHIRLQRPLKIAVDAGNGVAARGRDRAGPPHHSQNKRGPAVSNFFSPLACWPHH